MNPARLFLHCRGTEMGEQLQGCASRGRAAEESCSRQSNSLQQPRIYHLPSVSANTMSPAQCGHFYVLGVPAPCAEGCCSPISNVPRGGPSSGSVQTTQRAFTAARQALCVDPLGAPAVDSGRDIPAAGLQRSQGCESSRLCSMGFLSPSSLWHSLPSLTAFSPRHKPGHSCPPGRSQILPPPSNIFFPQQCFLISSHLFLP